MIFPNDAGCFAGVKPEINRTVNKIQIMPVIASGVCL
jgi:hypothetical protein